MNAYNAHLLNALTLLFMGGWGFFATKAPSALLPVFIGIVLLSFSQGIKNENKALAHVAVVVTLLGLIGIVMKPLMAALGSYDLSKQIRAIAMTVTSAIAVIFFVRSFIAAGKARRAREAAQK